MLDTLGERLQAERLTELNQRVRQRTPLARDLEPGDERPVDLQRVDRESAQIGERAVAGTEVVDRDPDSQRLQLFEQEGGGLRLAHQRGLGYLERERRRVEATLAQRPAELRDELRALELPGGHVDREVQVKPFLVPCGGPCTGLLEHPPSDRDDLSVLLGDRHEHVGRDDAPAGMAPAKQSLDSYDPLTLEIHDGLIDHEQLLCSQRLGQVHLQAYSVSRRGQHRGFKQDVAVSSDGLGLGQRKPRVVYQRLGRRGQARGDADTRRHQHRGPRLVGKLDRLPQHIQDPLGDELGAHVEPGRIDEHHKLVAAQAPHGVARSKDGLQSCAHPQQELVRGAAAKAVVELLEAVDAHQQRGDGDIQPARPREHPLGSVEHEGPVRQARERIVERAVFQLLALRLDQHPSAAPRTRKRAVEQDDEDCEHSAEEEGGGASRIG
jgi:hypothetical protein